MNKNIKYLLSTILLVILVCIGFVFLGNQKKYELNILSVIPINSEVILNINSLSDIELASNSDNKMLNDVLNMSFMSDFRGKNIELSQLCSKEGADLDRKMIVATRKVSKKRIDILYAFQIFNSSDEKDLLGVVDRYFSNSKKTYKSYGGEKIYIYKFNEIKTYVCALNGVILASKSIIFIEDAIKQFNSKSNILSLKSFQKIYNTMEENSDMNVYMNFTKLSDILTIVGNSSLNRIFNNISTFGAWLGLDVYLDKESIVFNGFSSSLNNTFSYIDVLSNQEPQKSELINSIPSSVKYFQMISLSDSKRYKKDMIKYRLGAGCLNSYRRGLYSIDRKYKCKFEDLFYSFFAGEATCLSLNSNTHNINKNKISIFKTIGTEKTKDIIENIVLKRAKSLKKNISAYKSKIRLDNQAKMDVYKLDVDYIPYKLMGAMFYKAPSKYCMVYKNNLIFAYSKRVLLQYLKSSILNKSIEDNERYIKISDKLSSKSNFLYYIDVYSSFNVLRNLFNTENTSVLNKNKEDLSHFHTLCLQMSSANGMVYNNLVSLYSKEELKKPSTLWETGLSSNVAIKPVVVKNHITGYSEIFLQDTDNNIYLINSLGRILWKVALSERINSEVEQIDMYKNNKLQYVFSTKSKIYVVDRNGNSVGNFPIKLSSPSNEGVSVFDYEGNRNYRFFIPTLNKKIYVYDTNAKKVKGWLFNRAENTINSKINHYRIGKKDYIIFTDRNRLYILNRKGAKRSTCPYVKTSGNDIFLVKGKSPYLLISSTDGSIYKIDFSGNKTKILHPKNISKKHKLLINDINCDGRNDYIYADSNKLVVYSDQKKLFKKTFKGNVASSLNIYHFSYNKRLLGICDKNTNQIYLIDKRGKYYYGFPVEGYTDFTITFLPEKQSGFFMFVGSNSQGLYKYKVK